MRVSPNARECKINCVYLPKSLRLCYPAPSLCVALDPVLCALLKSCTVLAVLVGDGRLDRIVRVGLDKQRLNEAQDGDDLVRRLPLVGAEQTETHGALVVVAHVGVVDLCAEAHDRWLEGVFGGKVDLELEEAALRTLVAEP
jgi:hypothetical protein